MLIMIFAAVAAVVAVATVAAVAAVLIISGLVFAHPRPKTIPELRQKITDAVNHINTNEKDMIRRAVHSFQVKFPL